jgi:hypothetical protein
MTGSSIVEPTLDTVFLDDTVAPVGRRPAHLASQSPPETFRDHQVVRHPPESGRCPTALAPTLSPVPKAASGKGEPAVFPSARGSAGVMHSWNSVACTRVTNLLPLCQVWVFRPELSIILHPDFFLVRSYVAPGYAS